MVDAAVQVEGIRPLIRQLKNIDDALPDELRTIARAAAQPVLEETLRRVPVGKLSDRRPRHPGLLRETIRIGATRRSGVVKAGTRAVRYAGPIHFGWPRRNIRPQPFMYDALDRRRGEVVDIYTKRLGEFVERVMHDGTGE